MLVMQSFPMVNIKIGLIRENMNKIDFKKIHPLSKKITVFDRAINIQKHFGNQDSRAMLIQRNDETHM